MFLFTIVVSISLLSAQSVPVSNHLVYDNIGSLATRVTHIHVAIPLNISSLYNHIKLFSAYLQPLLSHPNPGSKNTPADRQTAAFNNVIESIADLTMESLLLLESKLHSIQDIIPDDDESDISGPRHKRTSVLSEPTLIRHKRLTYYQENQQLKRDLASSQHVVEQLHHRIDQLNDQLKTFPSPYGPLPRSYFDPIPAFHTYPAFRHQTNDTLHRNKRQVMLAVAAVTGIVGTFMGLFDHVEINAIKSHLTKLDNSNNMLVHISEEHEHRIQHLTTDLADLVKVLNKFFIYNPTLLHARLNRQLTILSDRIDIIIDTFQHLQHHRLSVKLLSFAQLQILHNSVLTAASESNLTPLTAHLQDYFQLETSYIHTNDQLLILLHVPCSSLSNIFTLYKYIPFPFPVFPSLPSTHSSFNTIQDLVNLEHSVSPSQPMGLTVKADSDLIAIGKTEHNKQFYVILTTADLDACYSKTHTYICEHHQVVRSDMSGTCLGSLFIQNPEGIEGNCRIERRPLREKVYQLSPTDHLVYTPTPITTQIQCKNGTYFPLKIKATSRISIPHGCSVELTNHSIHSDFTLRIAPEAIHFEWDFNPATLPNSAKLLDGTKHIDAQLDLIRKHLGQTNNTIADEVFHQLMIEHLSKPNVISILIWTSICILGIVLVVAVVLWWRSRSLATSVSSNRQQYEMAFMSPQVPSAPAIQRQLGHPAF